jgi:uncharacterized membrane protein YhaH (DUF805 family)
MHYIVDFYKGRLSRKNFFVSYFIVLFILGIHFATQEIIIEFHLGIVSLITGLIVLYFAYGLVVRRLHDIGKSGWFSLIALLPLIGCLYIIFLAAYPGQKKKNKYGSPNK